jgi:hypothetical protein
MVAKYVPEIPINHHGLRWLEGSAKRQQRTLRTLWSTDIPANAWRPTRAADATSAADAASAARTQEEIENNKIGDGMWSLRCDLSMCQWFGQCNRRTLLPRHHVNVGHLMPLTSQANDLLNDVVSYSAFVGSCNIFRQLHNLLSSRTRRRQLSLATQVIPRRRIKT